MTGFLLSTKGDAKTLAKILDIEKGLKDTKEEIAASAEYAEKLESAED